MNSPTIFRTVQSLTPYCLPLCGHSQGPPQFLGTPTNSGTGKATDFFFILVYNYSPLKIFVKRERAHIQDCPIYPQPPVRKKNRTRFLRFAWTRLGSSDGVRSPPPFSPGHLRHRWMKSTIDKGTAHFGFRARVRSVSCGS